MKKVDYIVVGLGIAGVSCCEHLRRRGQDFIVIDHPYQSATKTAGGVVNPVVLKRFTAAWNANEFLEYATSFYHALEKHISSKIINEIDILRMFSSFEEQNQWLVASDKRDLSTFLSAEIYQDQTASWNNNFGYGKVNFGFQIDTDQLLKNVSIHLSSHHQYRNEIFNYDDLVIAKDEVRYKDLSARKIIFSEGASVIHNPFFPKEAILPKKGEYITIHAPELQLHSVLKGPFFVIPLNKDHFKVGATFAHGDDTREVTEKGRSQLVSALQKMLKVPFEVVEQEAGFRPTVKDRKPIVGNLPNHQNVYFFNGLGTRGLLMAPLMANLLLAYSEDKIKLPDEINLNRFFIKPSSDRI
jgi:glycine oxidase